MPLYDYRCQQCSANFEEFVHNKDDVVKCDFCKSVATRQFPSTIEVHSFPPEGLTLDNLPGGPVNFKNKTELRAYAKQHNLELGALL